MRVLLWHPGPTSITWPSLPCNTRILAGPKDQVLNRGASISVEIPELGMANWGLQITGYPRKLKGGLCNLSLGFLSYSLTQ